VSLDDEGRVGEVGVPVTCDLKPGDLCMWTYCVVTHKVTGIVTKMQCIVLIVEPCMSNAHTTLHIHNIVERGIRCDRLVKVSP
jgi:hypothetical protein